MPGVPVTHPYPLSLQGRGRGPRGAAAWEGEGTPGLRAPVRQPLTLALRAVPLPWREREDSWSRRAGGESRTAALSAAAAALLLAGCAASQSAAAVQPQAPGFLLGLWHGFIFPVAWLVSLFAGGVAVYAVPNNGGWYDFGYFLGIVVFGVGARKSARARHSGMPKTAGAHPHHGPVIDGEIVPGEERR
jgi:hypothetical protein